jgi:hypothetical protein
MSLPRSRSHNGPTNPRNKPQLKATRMRNSRRKGLRQSAKPRVDRPHGGGLSTGARQTVCKLRADHPKMPPEPPVLHLKKRTISALPADHPCGRDRLHSPRRPSDKLRGTKNTRQNGSKQRDTRTREERDELLPGRLLADRPLGACGPSAWCADSSPSSTS